MERNPQPASCLPPSPVEADQSAVFAFLANPATHGLSQGETVRRIDTHGAAVFLAGPHAYKVKRAVYFPFMDFSTLEKRKAACTAEVRISGANAPDLYLGVVPITRTATGLTLGGDGEVVDYAVKMHRFDPADTLDQVVERQGLDRHLASAIAATISAAHARAPAFPHHDTISQFADYISDNRAVFAMRPDLFDPGEANQLADATAAELRRLGPLLRRRAEAGFVRRCHGDLHLANIVVLNGGPVMFDAIEFNDDIAICDTLYDLAFLLMDLWQRDLWIAANSILNRYLWAADPAMLEAITALPFFLSVRAAIRAKVEAAGLAHQAPEAQARATQRVRHLFHTARVALGLAPQTFPADLRPEDLPPTLPTPLPTLAAIGGLSGTGKTTRALRWAPFIGRPPGAVVLRSDVERKRMFHVAETQPLPPDAYAPAVTQQVYAHLQQLAGAVLDQGQSVMLDAVHAHPEERDAARATARAQDVAFQGFWLEAPLNVRIARVDRRKSARKDASDADATVVQHQQSYELGPIDWLVLPSG